MGESELHTQREQLMKSTSLRMRRLKLSSSDCDEDRTDGQDPGRDKDATRMITAPVALKIYAFRPAWLPTTYSILKRWSL
jgi:hypothetical protein